MENNSVRFLDSRIRANQRNANTLNRTARVKRTNANTKRQQLLKEVENLEVMKRDLEEYKTLVAENIPDVPDFVSNYIKGNQDSVVEHLPHYLRQTWEQTAPFHQQAMSSIGILGQYWRKVIGDNYQLLYNKYDTVISPNPPHPSSPKYMNQKDPYAGFHSNFMTREGLEIIRPLVEKSHYQAQGYDPDGDRNRAWQATSESLRAFFRNIRKIIQKLETNLIPAQEAKIQQIENDIAGTSASANNYSLKTATKRNNIKATQREKAEQEENMELRKNRLYNYFKSPKNLQRLTETMWEIPESMNMSKVGMYRAKNPRNIRVYTRPRKTRRQRRYIPNI